MSNANEKATQKDENASSIGNESSSRSPSDPPLATTAPASGAASSSVGTTTMADALYAVETMVQVFGFSFEAANQAVEEVGGSDIQRCYNYILDRGLGHDTGGAVYPIDSCPHLTQVQVTPDQFQSSNSALPVRSTVLQRRCSYSSSTGRTGTLKSETVGNENGSSSCPTGENWVCLTCGEVFCSRYVNGHGLQHWKDTCDAADGVPSSGHCVAVSLTDLSVWCHACQAYLVTHRNEKTAVLQPLVEALEHLKFPAEDDDAAK